MVSISAGWWWCSVSIVASPRVWMTISVTIIVSPGFWFTTAASRVVSTGGWTTSLPIVAISAGWWWCSRCLLFNGLWINADVWTTSLPIVTIIIEDFLIFWCHTMAKHQCAKVVKWTGIRIISIWKRSIFLVHRFKPSCPDIIDSRFWGRSPLDIILHHHFHESGKLYTTWGYFIQWWLMSVPR